MLPVQVRRVATWAAPVGIVAAFMLLTLRAATPSPSVIDQPLKEAVVRKDVPGVVAVTWFGIVAPPQTPSSITLKLSQTVAEILKSPDMARRYAEAGATPVGNSPHEMTAWMREDAERWAQVIKAANIKVD